MRAWHFKMSLAVLAAMCAVSFGATTTSISQFGITWTFDQPVEYGQFANGDYWLPASVLEKSDAIELPYFNTPEFFAELQEKVLEKFDALVEANLPTLP